MFGWFQIDLLAYFFCWLPSEDLQYLFSLPVFVLMLMKTERTSWQNSVTFAFLDFFLPFLQSWLPCPKPSFAFQTSFRFLSLFSTEKGGHLLPLTFGFTCIHTKMLFLLEGFLSLKRNVLFSSFLFQLKEFQVASVGKYYFTYSWGGQSGEQMLFLIPEMGLCLRLVLR